MWTVTSLIILYAHKDVDFTNNPIQQNKHVEDMITDTHDVPSRVWIKVQGGLGNQLFQIAAIQHYATVHHMKATVFLEDEHNVPCITSTTYHTEILDAIIERQSKIGENPRYITEPHEFTYVPLPSPDKNTVLSGYFQSPLYIEDRAFWQSIALKWTPRNLPPDSISMHVRRGDYVRLGVALDKSYYDLCLTRVDRVEDRPLYIFTNDKLWCQSSFPNAYIIDEELKDFQEMALMSTAKTLIISNSTFSWWSAFMASQSTQVYAPRNWVIHNVPESFFLNHWNVIT